MPVRESLRWSLDLPDPGEVLTQDERDQRHTLGWTIFILLIGGILATAVAVVASFL